jgi:hypothetical protein
MKSGEDPRLARLTKLALALPQTTREGRGSRAQFLVRKKTFAYFLDNHHGDGIVALTCKVLPGEQPAVDRGPARQILARLHRIARMGRTPPRHRQNRLE